MLVKLQQALLTHLLLHPSPVLLRRPQALLNLRQALLTCPLLHPTVWLARLCQEGLRKQVQSQLQGWR